MKTPEQDDFPAVDLAARPADTIVVVGAADPVSAVLEDLHFVPSLRIERISGPPPVAPADGDRTLLFLLGRSPALPDTRSIQEWLDQLDGVGGPPVALLLPRPEDRWCALASHPQCCGLLAGEPRLEPAELERVIAAARGAEAERFRLAHPPAGRFSWNFSTAEAANAERTWLVIMSLLADLRGVHDELPHLGMAITEAITNAIEHGNLELPSSLKDEGDGMDRFYAERTRRLADPFYARRRLRIEVRLRPGVLQVRLRNQGPGFNPKAAVRPETAPPQRNHPYGLGLRMIEGLVDSVAIAPDGRGITLTASLPGRSHRQAA